MKLRKVGIWVAVIGFALLGVSLFGFTSKSQTTTVLESGPAVNGLQLSISLDNPGKDGSPILLVTLENRGKEDVLLNLGAIVGQYQSPNAFHLSIKDDAGNMKEYHFVDNRYSGVAGRIDNYILPLRNGASYSLKLPLKQFWPSKLNLEEFPFKKLTHGTYKVDATFDGNGYNYNNIGGQWDAYANFIWKGKLQSNTISFEQ